MRHGARSEQLAGARIGMAGGVCKGYVILRNSVRMIPFLMLCPDFRRRFVTLLSYKFREFGSVMALSVLEAANQGVKKLDEDPSRGERCAV